MLHWRTIQIQTYAFVQRGAEQFLHSLSSTAAEISHNGIKHVSSTSKRYDRSTAFYKKSNEREVLLSATQNLKQDHLTLKRVRNITQRCSEKLYANQKIPLEDLEIISVVIEEFVDRFHHGKEEQAYFPETRDKNGFSEDIRKFLIEHELGRRIARMFLRNLNIWKEGGEKASIEPLARFLRSYSVFITDHTGKEDKFFDMIEENHSLSEQENEVLIRHFEKCRSQVGGAARIEQMMKLIEYLEDREWMK